MPVCPPRSEQDRTRFEHVAGKLLKDWASSIMREGHTRAEAREMILDDLRARKQPTNQIIIRIPRFVRRPFWRGWTIGWDWNNNAILQFTKTVPYEHKYICWSLFFVRYSYASLNVQAKEGRYFLNIGWNV
jgi:hypothetical protein